MKVAACLIALTLVSLAKAQPNSASAKTFKVSQAGKDKAELLSVFKAVQDAEWQKEAGDPESFQIIQVLGPAEFLVRTLGAGVSRNLLLVTKKPINAADGEAIRGIFIAVTERTHSYTATSGAKVTVRIAEEIDPPPLMTQKDFVAQLKAGKTWTLKSFKPESCSACFGDGKLSALHDYARCSDCGGKGGWKVDLLVTW